MENFKEKIPTILGVIILFAFCWLGYYLLFVQNSLYYTKIDNENLKKISSSDMRYQYTLTAYNRNGKKKEITFKTRRELKEDAYLEVEIMMVRGVKSWKEIQYDELPKKVQLKYQ